MQENYKILGLEEGATAEQVREAYERLRARYAEDRFLDGERGNEAAKNLTLVESAYREIMADMASRTHAENEKFDYSSVENRTTFRRRSAFWTRSPTATRNGIISSPSYSTASSG